MEWNDVRFFLALARSGSVRAAGASLGVSHSTVARRVEALEEQLSTRLFDRHRDGYQLTAAGERMVAGAERVESEMCALSRTLGGVDERLAGPVSVTCCDTFVASMVMTDLAPFVRQYPEIELAFTTDSRAFDLAKREADIAIRTLPKDTDPPPFLIGQKLAPVVVANYVAKAHQSTLPESSARWISAETRKIQEHLIATSSFPNVPAWGSFSSLDVMVQAARDGMGWVMLPTYVGDADEALVRLAPADLRHLADLWLVSHPDLRDNARLLATRRSIGETFKQQHAIFRGE